VTTSVEPLAQTGRLIGVQPTRCENLLRLSGTICAARQSADYAAGYADALADNADAKAEKGSRG